MRVYAAHGEFIVQKKRKSAGSDAEDGGAKPKAASRTKKSEKAEGGKEQPKKKRAKKDKDAPKGKCKQSRLVVVCCAELSFNVCRRVKLLHHVLHGREAQGLTCCSSSFVPVPLLRNCSHFSFQVLLENPSISIGDCSKEIGLRWKTLTSEEKAPFEERARADKDRFESHHFI